MNILDEDLSDQEVAYRTFVDRAPELVEAVRTLLRERGQDGSLHELHHVWWRFLRESRRWRTVRNAILDGAADDRPEVSGQAQPRSQVQPESEAPPPPPAQSTPPSRPARCIVVARGPFHPRFYSYWANAWVGPDGATFVFGGALDNRARFFRIGRDGEVQALGPLLPFEGTTEGWYWDRDGWIYVPHGARLLHVNPFTGEQAEVFDAAAKWPGLRIWQAHSSDDGRAHCATLQRTDNWQKVATVVCRDGEMWKIDANADLDESDIDTTGTWVLIKEGAGPDNRIVAADSRQERFIADEDGALGHSAMGAGFAVGEADKPEPGRCVLLDLATGGRRDLFPTWNMGHVAVRGDRILVSNATARELAVIDRRDGVYQPVLTGIAGWGGDYDSQVRANLSPCGRRACFMVDGAVQVLDLS